VHRYYDYLHVLQDEAESAEGKPWQGRRRIACPAWPKPHRTPVCGHGEAGQRRDRGRSPPSEGRQRGGAQAEPSGQAGRADIIVRTGWAVSA
jgi:hypothetical protein